MTTGAIDGRIVCGGNAEDIKTLRPNTERARRCWARWALFAFGWLNVALGIIGIVLPGMPTTVFLIMAAWAFSKCSDRFHGWLWSHPRLGATVRSWHRHRAIPRRAKIVAVATMSASFLILTAFVADGWLLPSIAGAGMLPAAAYILTRPSIAA